MRQVLRHLKNRITATSGTRLAAAALLLVAGAAHGTPPGPGPQIGTNLGFLSDNSGDWPFVDVFKTSTGWYPSGACGWNCGTLELDDDGWVKSLDSGQMATALIFTNVPNSMPHGDVTHEYNIFYDGTGVIDYDGSVVSVEEVEEGHDRVRIDPTSDEPFALTIVITARTWDPEEIISASEYIRNIRVIAPGGVCSDNAYLACTETAECGAGAACNPFVLNKNSVPPRFHPRFLENVRRFGVIRLMDWMDTIEGGLSTASELSAETDARWNIAPASVMADLANTLDVDIWVNIPHLADDPLILQFAQELAASLENGRKLFVEYSNELWNRDFPGYREVGVLACQRYTDLTPSCYRRDSSGAIISSLCEEHDQNPIPGCDAARIRYTTERSLEAWAIFEAAFDAQSSPGGNGNSSAQLVRVLASRSGDTDLHEDLLDYQDAYLTVDAFATAGYFGWPLGGDPVVQLWDPSEPGDMDDLFVRLQTEVDETIDDMRTDHFFLKNHDQGVFSEIPLVLYEGGQGLVTWGPNDDDGAAEAHANALFDAANRDPRMGDRYRQLLDGWRQYGGDTLFNHYVNTRSYNDEERYGALEHQRQLHSDSPKYNALKLFIAGLP